jgi:S-adenosylmethionine synthetase
MNLVVRSVPPAPPAEVEVVERKGRGHPDSVCDALAESISRALSRLYVARAGHVLHHNVDKILLAAGSSRAAFGGGTVLAPIDVYLGGRVTREFDGQTLPVDDVAVDACRAWMRGAFRALDPDRHVRFHPVFGTSAPELSALHARDGGDVMAGDSSIGVGFAPFTPLEQLVRAVEEDINAPATKDECPELGEDVKVMGVRVGDRFELSVACGFIAAHVRSLPDYVEKKARLADRISALARAATGQDVAVAINAGDLTDRGAVYLTVTGTSAEHGDDGQVGRGNRANGLITPYRLMTLEALAGKSPRNHVGKLYQLSAQNIATAASGLAGVRGAQVCLVSRIGRPLSEPQLADVALATNRDALSGDVRGAIDLMVTAELSRVSTLWRALVA